MLLYRCGPLGWLHERRSGRWNKAARLGTVASVGWLNQAIKKASLTNAVLPPRSAFHQPRGRMKYASAEGNVPYLCPGGDKFIAHSAIYNPSEPRRSGSRYLSRAGVASSVVAPAWRVSQWAAVWAEQGDSDNIFVAVDSLLRSSRSSVKTFSHMLGHKHRYFSYFLFSYWVLCGCVCRWLNRPKCIFWLWKIRLLLRNARITCKNIMSCLHSLV